MAKKTDSVTEQKIRELLENGETMSETARITRISRQTVEKIAKTCKLPQKKSSAIPLSVWREWDFWTRYIRRRIN